MFNFFAACAKKIEACGETIPGTLIKRFSGVDPNHFPFVHGFIITEEFCR